MLIVDMCWIYDGDKT